MGFRHARELKRGGKFKADMLAITTFERNLLREGLDKAIREHEVEGSRQEKGEALRKLRVGLSEHGFRRAWLMNQLAASVGVPGVRDALIQGKNGPGFVRVFEEVVEPVYRGGLELALGMMVVALEAWIEGQTGVDENDFWDHLMMASVGDGPDCIFVTEERKWQALAKRAGLEARVLSLEETQPRRAQGIRKSVDWAAVDSLVKGGR